ARSGPLRARHGFARHREPVRGHGLEPRDDGGRARGAGLDAGPLRGRAVGRLPQPGRPGARDDLARHLGPSQRAAGRGRALHRPPRRSGPCPWASASWPWPSGSFEAKAMSSDDVVILCAAGMLVTAYLMVGQKALFVAIRLYGLQSVLLGAVALTMGLADHRFHLFTGSAL